MTNDVEHESSTDLIQKSWLKIMLQGTVFIFIVGIIFNLSFAKNLQPIETSEINKRDLLGIFENMFQQRSE